MLEDILGPDGEPDETEDEIGEDLEEGYLADYAPINFVDPSLALVVIQLKVNEIISKDEARELLGFDASGS